MYRLRNIMLLLFYFFLLLLSFNLSATDLNLINGAYYSTSTFLDYSDSAGLPGEQTYYIVPQYHYLFLFSNIRLQNVASHKWKFVSKMNEKIIQSKKTETDYRLRNLYFENTEAIKEKWFVAGGRLPADSFWPLRRQDGAKVIYALNKNNQIGVKAGSIPQEESSYINFDEPSNTGSIFYKKKNDKGDYLECALGTFYEKNGKTLYRLNTRWNKSYSLHKHDSYFKAGSILRAPENIFENLYVENGYYQNDSILHYMGIFYNRNIFVYSDNSPNAKLQYEDIMSTNALYGLSLFPKKSLWRANFNSGINYSENLFGYLARVTLHRKKIFYKDGNWDIKAELNKIGYFDRKTVGTGFSTIAFSRFLWRTDISLQTIYFKKNRTYAVIFGQSFSADYSSGLSWQSNISIMNYMQGNVELYIDAFLIHFLYKEYKEIKEKKYNG